MNVLDRLRAMQAGDVPVTGGHTLAYVYDSGLAEAERVGRDAVAQYAGSNGLDPTAFPSLLQMENELVGFAGRLLDAPEGFVGTVSSGGTESVLLAVQGARDASSSVRPNMVLPSTIHAAFLKGAHYFGVEARIAPVGPDYRASVEAMAALVDDDTVLLAGSAPSYAHGVVDPITDIAALAASRGIRCHVDGCIGGWVLPFAARLGREVPAWTFAVPGVTSISVDLHKYAYAPKGTSILLHRSSSLRRPQYFARADWPGYTMLNSTMQSTKSGGPLAGAWAVVNTIGEDGYLELSRTLFAAMDQLVAGLAAHEHLAIVAPPDSSLIAFTTGDSLDVFTLTDEMTRRGWYVQPQLSFADQPPNVHLSVSPATDVTAFLAALEEAVEASAAAGPVSVDPGIVEFVQSLDPATLSDEDFDGLLAAVGMAGGDSVGLPESMAEINALLDIATPALREALLVAFLDRLQRPTPPL